ncbi:conjugated bile salt MFS transporter [uncultured Clostridium sp.]|uniref:conjugated bile salt MFS transporter n=1 Tax=uncultured Clostridium sp. TaxID=59620 RepID=UPI002627DFD6|nr:conjugated bile salt MFS transporter [uncultured Clostridium sp.]
MGSVSTTHTSNSKRKIFMIFIAMIIQAIPFGVAQNIQPLFIPYVVKHFSFSLAAFSLIFTFGALASSVCSPFLGKLFGKVNLKILFIIGTVLSSLGFLGMGLATNLPEFYILSAIMQVGCVLFSGLGIPFLIGSWFPTTGRGKALGIAFAGGSIGNVFLQPIVSNILGSHGESFSYILFGIISLIFSLVIVLLFVRIPKQGEIEEVTSEKTQENSTTSKAVVYEGPGAAATRKEKYFWLFATGYAFIGIAISACSTQYASYFRMQLHLDAHLIGILGSVFALFCLIGNVGGGALFDKIGSFKAMILAFIFQGLSIIGMLLAGSSHGFAFLFSICYGLCVFSYMSGPAFLSTDVFGRKDASVNLGTMSLLFAIGFALGSVIFGAFAQSIGFKVAWIAMIVFLVVGYGLLLTSISVMKRRQKAELSKVTA